MISKTSLYAGIAAVAVMAYGQAAFAATTLKVSSCLEKVHDQVVVYFKTFHDPINAMNGDLKLHYIGGPEITPRQKQALALKRGLVDIINCPSTYYAGQVPEARLTGASNMSPQALRKNGAIALMEKAWAKGINAKILGWGYFGGADFHIYTNFEPKISKTTGIDLTGQKIRSTGLYHPFLKAMGATPVDISAGDVYTALERGVVKGLAWPEGAVVKYGWQRFLKYRVYPGFFRSTTMNIINLDKFNSLTKSQQAVLVKQGLIFEEESGRELRKIADIDNKKLFDAGVKKLHLKGATAEAYLATIYGKKWEDNAKRKYNLDFEELKALMYQPGS